jgi:cyclic pyranopterin monophosphate synthase
MPTLPNTFLTGDPQVGHSVSGSSWKDWATSKFFWQLSQRYSYVGKRALPFDPRCLGLAVYLRECQCRPEGRRPVHLERMSDRSLSHLDPFSGTRMVDVSPKEATHRRALARCKVVMKPETTAKVANNAITKGDVLAAARVAGIQAAKRTADLVPMCHPLLVGAVHVDFTIGDDYVEVEAKVETIDRTGVEMEAMTACAIAALTVYDMCKTTDRTMSIGELMLWEKTGGSSGMWKRDQLD